MNNTYHSRKQGGFTGIELSVTMLILGILATGAFFLVQGLFGKSASKIQSDYEISCYNSMKSIYGQNPNYTGLTDSLVAEGDLCPEPMENATNDGLVNEWGGVVTVAPLDNASNVDKVTFETTLIDRDSCSSFASSLSNVARGVAVDSGTGFTWVKDYDAFDGTVINSLQEASLLAACNTGTANTVTVKTYYR